MTLSRLIPAALLVASTLAAQTPAPLRTRADTLRVDSLLARADAGRIQGAPSATIWIVELSDFQCPYCKRWHEETYPALKREFVDKGIVRLAYVQFPLSMHKHAEAASVASMCASEQDKFWPMHDKLFQTQDKWKDLPSVGKIFDSLAVASRVDASRWRACIGSGQMRRIVDADVSRGARVGVRSTPTFWVGDQPILGAQPIDSFRVAIQRQLAKAGRRP